MPLVSSGVEHGNLRELALARMKDMGTEVIIVKIIFERFYLVGFINQQTLSKNHTVGSYSAGM